jgi:hypothetical protein
LTVTPPAGRVFGDAGRDAFGPPDGFEAATPVDVDPALSEADLFVSAAATPWPVATAVTNHAATTMPPYPPNLTARADLWERGLNELCA